MILPDISVVAGAAVTAISGIGATWLWSTKLYASHEREKQASDSRHAAQKKDLDGVAARMRSIEAEFKLFRARTVTVIMALARDRQDREFIANQFKD